VYKIKYLPSFETDLIEAEDYLFEHSPPAVDKLTDAINEQLLNVTEHPYMYAVYSEFEDLRYMILPYQYLLFYTVDEGRKYVEVYRLLRGMRDIPNLL
jgi:plasmid stabilization system protein ParE